MPLQTPSAPYMTDVFGLLGLASATVNEVKQLLEGRKGNLANMARPAQQTRAIICPASALS